MMLDIIGSVVVCFMSFVTQFTESAINHVQKPTGFAVMLCIKCALFIRMYDGGRVGC